ncbi:flocculation protein FLO11-like [Aristolochia californica]|uniref:flocculation protein FLO11-like n=1 Tax=Aristolochia californica TaxID=171875 RepID=UPI0035DD4A72
MNRSFRGPESPKQTSVQQRPGRTLGTMMKEKEEELALFLEMRKREKERNNLLLQSPDQLASPLGQKGGSSPIFKIMSSTPPRKTATDDFLNSEGDKSDYDWLLTPPGTPLFPSLEAETNKHTVMSQIGTPKTRPTAMKSRLANPQGQPNSRGNAVTRPSSSPGLNSSSTGIRRPSSSGGPGSTTSRISRPATPSGRPVLLSTSKPSRPSTPTSRASIPSKPTVPSTKPSAAVARSSTPTARPTLPSAAKTATRSATPTRRPSTPSSRPASTGPPGRSSSVTKTAPPPKNPVPSRGTSPTVKSRPWKPSEMPGFSLDAPPNLRTSLPERPLSASRGRPGAPSTRSSSVEPSPNGRPRRQSCSPSRGRASNGSNHGSGSSVLTNRSHSNGSDCPSPVLIGTKMVERVINMRKLAPPKVDEQRSSLGNTAGKSSSSPDSSGFGRNLSKKSLDMALRHMDFRRSIPGNLHPLMTNIPASSMYSVRSGPVRSRTISVSDSPIATSSNCSSEQSVNNNALCLEGIEIEDDLGGVRREAISLH